MTHENNNDEFSSISDTIQELRPDELECLFAITPKREMGDVVRNAVRLRFEHGYNYGMAARKAGCTQQMLSRAEKTLLNKHNEIMKVYR